jgi:hypothetical protein
MHFVMTCVGGETRGYLWRCGHQIEMIDNTVDRLILYN